MRASNFILCEQRSLKTTVLISKFNFPTLYKTVNYKSYPYIKIVKVFRIAFIPW
jgi:hypothetical protein